METVKVVVSASPKMWNWIFAREKIQKGEIIADWSNWIIYKAYKASDLAQNIRDYAIQISENEWIDYNGIGRNFNHSCEANCGFNGRLQIVTMRDIEQGEELFFDYEMSENSDWRIECLCGNVRCRGIIGAYKNMPEEVRKKYGTYISSWLRENN